MNARAAIWTKAYFDRARIVIARDAANSIAGPRQLLPVQLRASGGLPLQVHGALKL